MVRLSFRAKRLYESPPESVYSNAIVRYRKEPWWQNYKAVEVWHHKLVVDLWVLTLCFEWLSGYKKSRKESNHED